MKMTSNLRFIRIAAVVLAGLATFAWIQRGDGAATGTDDAGPQLSPVAMAGKPAYDANCSECHGVHGAGSDKGPPFVHEVYNPGHHSDASFARAVGQGVRQHHWRFGDMPAQPQVTNAQLEAIVRYVRAVQESRGITYRPHTM
jgi:mono/diheme cytochrome c family protein